MSNHLNSVAMLVDFSVSQATFRKIDKERSIEVNEAANASRKASHVSKKIIMADTHTMIGTVKNRAYARHTELTLPWLDTGPRILPAAMHGQYVADMEKFEAEFHALVRTFVANYPTYVAQASAQHVALGKLFNAADYPAPSRIASKFGWRLTYLPIPDADDFRVNIGASQVARIKADIERTMQASVANAAHDMLERISSVVVAMVDKLNAYVPAANPGDKTQGIFRDSLVENVRDLVAILPALNFANDARITKLTNDLAALCQHDAETLRASDAIRKDVAAQAATIVQAVSDFMA